MIPFLFAFSNCCIIEIHIFTFCIALHFKFTFTFTSLHQKLPVTFVTFVTFVIASQSFYLFTLLLFYL